MKVYYHQFDTALGMLRIAFTKYAVVKLDFPNQSEDDMIFWLSRHFDEISKYNSSENEFSKIVTKYLEGKTNEIDIPVQLYGTSFQKQVWKQLKTIPYGEVSTYKEIAIKIGKGKASRAIGQANNKNSIPIIIPCHRVIGSNGSLVGFAGGLDIKIKLLELEGIKVNSIIKNKIIQYYI